MTLLIALGSYWNEYGRSLFTSGYTELGNSEEFNSLEAMPYE